METPSIPRKVVPLLWIAIDPIHSEPANTGFMSSRGPPLKFFHDWLRDIRYKQYAAFVRKPPAKATGQTAKGAQVGAAPASRAFSTMSPPKAKAIFSKEAINPETTAKARMAR